MLCTRCKKRQAVVFVQRLENGKPVQEGYCLTCARELHILRSALSRQDMIYLISGS